MLSSKKFTMPMHGTHAWQGHFCLQQSDLSHLDIIITLSPSPSLLLVVTGLEGSKC